MRYYSDAELEAYLDDDDDDDESLEIMSEDDDDEDEFYEDDEDEFYALEADDAESEFIDDDDDDDEAERRFFRRRRSRIRRRGRRFRRSPRRRFAIKGKKSARVMTRGGRSATVRFNKSFATAADVKKAIDTLAKDVRKNGTGIVRLDKEMKRVDSSTKKAMTKQNNRLSSFEKSVKKQIATAKQEAQQAALLPLILGSGDSDDGGLDPIVLLAMTGGLGGSGGSSSGGLDPVTLLAITGGLG